MNRGRSRTKQESGEVPPPSADSAGPVHRPIPTVKIRFWPSAAETAALFRGLRVATDLFVAQRAPALTLGEMVRILGRRAEQLTELWNDWPRLRPVLLAAIIE